MNKFKLLNQYLPRSVVCVAIISVIGYIQASTGLPLANITILWFVQFIVLYLFFKAKKYYCNRSQASILFFINFYLIWNIFSFVRGAFIADTYWDWKSLVGNGLALLIPLVAFVATNTKAVQLILKYYITYGLGLFVILILVINSGAYGFYLVPISFLALFLPVIKSPWRWIIAAFCLFVVFADFGARSSVIKFGVPVILSFIYYIRIIFSKKIFELIRKVLMLAPLVLFSLAVSGSFNIFKMDEYLDGNYVEVRINKDGEKEKENLTADTRTILYVDVLKTAKVYNSWIIGRSPARGNISESFGKEDMSGREERSANEVAILNIFTWTGIVGVILYFLVFYKASYLAINQSNNVFIKILGLFVSFRWLFSWAEDINNFSLNYFFLWIMIGLCYSKAFRSMSNKEVKLWVQGIFDKKKTNSRIVS